ncbi:hypothetical protein MRX96_036371 [Rhipicephalus microplus]
MAAKVMRYNVAESNMMFRTNETTGSITREQLKSGGKKFLEELGKPHAFLAMSASEVHWERLLEILERLRVGPDGTLRPVSEMMA